VAQKYYIYYEDDTGDDDNPVLESGLLVCDTHGDAVEEIIRISRRLPGAIIRVVLGVELQVTARIDVSLGGEK
jgi:hypothetical protein